MPGQNDFRAFAAGGGANALTPSAYAALTALLANGFQAGPASSAQINTVLRQVTSIAAALGKIISDAELNAVDDGNVATLAARILSALQASFPLRSEVNTRSAYAYTQSDWLWLDKPRGLKLQYGVLPISGNGQSWMSGVASFPLAFTTACFGVWGVGTTLRSGGGLNAPGEIVLTAFGDYSGAAPATFRWRIDTNVTLSLSGSLPVVWFAIGV